MTAKLLGPWCPGARRELAEWQVTDERRRDRPNERARAESPQLVSALTHAGPARAAPGGVGDDSPASHAAADRGLRTARGHPDRRVGGARRLHRLVVPPPLRLRRLFCRAPRNRATRHLADLPARRDPRGKAAVS